MHKKETHGRHEENTEGLKELLYKCLKGRKYLIVMDDVWDDEILDELRRSFPNDENRSRIMLTTRLEQVGLHCPRSYLHRVHFLNEDESCSLFCEKVFGENSFPPELEIVGKKICRNCRGIPLSIVVIARLLSKATKTHHEWEKIAENMSFVITSNDEQCSKILDLSYNNLPHHLKGCYLYMGIFPEDSDIPVSLLFKLWIAEGFVKFMGSKTIEDAAEEYLLDLVQRSLVMVSEESSRGKIKACKLHALLRNLCTNEARRGNFFHVSSHGTPLDVRCLRRTIIQGKSDGSGHRVRIHPDKSFLPRVKRPSTPLPRSIIYFDRHLVTKFVYFRLLKVLYIHYNMFDLPKEIMELVNLRCIDARCDEGWLNYLLAFNLINVISMKP
ncbi:putative late blight resistance protein homolog R1A-10 [Olea europaea var. sylvestris]|uniref:putative late blight resistance protein homolog R1A-10 n=1 Tax=Olea europaea var. sylvestris TaxID=158386 RepID=UPI000C1D19B2|nr:putative late blight resistance protein homolog R1A-10 [Olea europaea var. sylvestris]